MNSSFDSRIEWTEEGERSTKYFFGLGKSRAKKNIINNITCPEKGALFEQHNISNHIVEFYRNLYMSTNPNVSSMEQYLDSSNINNLDSSIANSYSSLDRDLSLFEMDEIVEQLQNDKSPGWDGLTAEF